MMVAVPDRAAHGKAGCGSMNRLPIAPREWKCSRTRPSNEAHAIARRGARHAGGQIAASSSPDDGRHSTSDMPELLNAAKGGEVHPQPPSR